MIEAPVLPDRYRAFSLCNWSGLLGLILFAAGLAACQPGENQSRQSDQTVDTAAVKSALDSIRHTFIAAYEAGDAEKIASLWTEQGRQAIPMAAPVRGRDTIEALTKQAFESNSATREATVDTVRDVRALSDDWAYSYTTWTFRVTPADADQPETTTATFVILYRKTPDGWKTHLEVGSPHKVQGG